MSRIALLLWTFLSYCLVAGIAWYWVLGMQFSVWRLMGVALLQMLCFALQMIVGTKGKH